MLFYPRFVGSGLDLVVLTYPGLISLCCYVLFAQNGINLVKSLESTYHVFAKSSSFPLGVRIFS